MRLLLSKYSLEEEWGFLLIDAKNDFNEENGTEILWDVRHEWPSGMQFTFNCYRHWELWWCATRRTGQATS